MASGKQYVSWVHEIDVCRVIASLIASGLAGTFNVSAPSPVQNKTFMKLLRKQLKRPIGLASAKWTRELGAIFLRTETELILKSRYVIPSRLQKAGFQFTFPELSGGLEDVLK